MITCADAQHNHVGKYRNKRTAHVRRTAHVVYAPFELEQRVLSDAGRQIEEVAFALAGRISAEKTGELMEIAARIQNIRVIP